MKASCIAAVAFLALLAGCAGQRVKMSEDNRKTLTTQPVHAVHVEPTGFGVESTGYTVAGVLFTPLVALGQVAEGSEMRSGLGLEDPVVRVKERLLVALEENYRIPNVIRVAQPASRFSPDTQYKSLSGVVLEVRTTKWGIDNNRAKYAAGVRVVRLSDSVELWNAVCDDVVPDKGKPSPTIEMLRADRGALLKAKLVQAADACTDQLVAWAIERVESR
jgi:hypothetical protein